MLPPTRGDAQGNGGGGGETIGNVIRVKNLYVPDSNENPTMYSYHMPPVLAGMLAARLSHVVSKHLNSMRTKCDRIIVFSDSFYRPNAIE